MASVVVPLTGGLVLVGWGLDIAPLKSVFPGLPKMVPNTALAVTLAGTALGLLRKEPVPPLRRGLAGAFSAGAALIGLFTLAEYLFGWDLGLDQLLVSQSARVGEGPIPGRPGFHTALTLALTGLAFLLLDVRQRRGPQPAHLLMLLAALIALLALIGYACGVPAFYGSVSFWPNTGMALHTALLVPLLGAGLVCARPAAGLMAILLSTGPGGTVVRWLLLAPVVLPLVLGWLRLAGQRAGLYNPDLGGWLFALSNIAVFTLIIWWNASVLHRADAERTRAEQSFRVAAETATELNLQLADANKELEAFCYSVSHDLRAPLRAIDGFSRICLEEHAPALPDEAREYLHDIRRNTQHMGRLIDDLLTLSRMSRQPIHQQAVSMTALVRQCLEDLRREREGRRVEVIVGELPDCEGDPSLLKQVWMNLLSNALKYTRPRDPAVIEICCGAPPQDKGGVQPYCVRDNGVGFDMAYAGKLFGVFQRLHRAEEFEGTGVGLAIVQRIIHRHGGRIWAEAEPGKGATFCFTLGGAPHD
jgi:signal transduction histidine kinase